MLLSKHGSHLNNRQRKTTKTNTTVDCYLDALSTTQKAQGS